MNIYVCLYKTDLANIFQDKLKNLIESAVKDCARSLFIFDEIDVAPPGLLHLLVSYLDYVDPNGLDCRKATFIYLR